MASCGGLSNDTWSGIRFERVKVMKSYLLSLGVILLLNGGRVMAQAPNLSTCLTATGNWNFVAIEYGGVINDRVISYLVGNSGGAMMTYCSIGGRPYAAFYHFPTTEARIAFHRGVVTWLRSSGMTATILDRAAAKSIGY